MISFSIVMFTIIQLINVVLSTCKSVITVKGNVYASMFMNAISYTFYAVVVKLIPMQDMLVVILVTFGTNLIGVYIANWLLDKFKTVKQWVFECSIKNNNEAEYIKEFKEIEDTLNILNTMGIKYISNEATDYKNDNIQYVKIFAESKEDSKIVQQLLKKYNIKFHILESK